MHESPLVSVITVVYNGEEFIEETLKSVSSQSYTNIQYIVVDGQSNDNTMSIISRFKNSVNNLISGPDTGIYNAMNKGIKLATGDYVNFLNAGDTFADSDTISKIFNRDLNEYNLIYGDIYAKEESGKKRMIKAVDFTGDKSIVKGMKVCHQAIFYHKNILHPYDESLVLKAEWKHLVEISRKSIFKPYKLGFPVVNYSLGGLSAQRNKLNQQEYRKVFLELFGPRKYLCYTPFFIGMYIRRIIKGLLTR
ncbi:glycosyltransferase family 2 protein [Vibrio ezurae]|uniref:Putative glycosyltransferase n=1 Tax=Vibrio ezurae NBRC 102218 TaxID=1219080 RepID=U3B0Y7_9VIBR|nr:glycosyltransferase family 2 protein [Vibrio ezurae]GAD79635.1 putative glycosyltransferase [Vibrio ezurae NBRC 102218]